LLLKYFRRYAEKRKLNAQKIKICAIYVVERLSDEIFLTQKLKMQIIFNMKISRSTVYNLASLSGSCAGEWSYVWQCCASNEVMLCQDW